MTRISLQEQYENKDVIQQIYSLKDDVNRVSETTDNVNKDVIQQINNVKDNMNTVSRTAEEAKTLAQQASDTAETAATTAQGSITSGAIVADTVSAKLKLNKVSGESEDSVIPIASASQTGMMNAQTYAGITNLDARVSVLERKTTTMYVTFPNDPEQSIITSTFQTKAGRPPVAGDYAVDITRNLTYGYDGSVWIKVDTDVPIPQFSIDTPGLIKGNDEDGTVFAEADGTGSIKGWDALKQSVADNSTAIEQNSTAIEQNSTAIVKKQAALVTATASLTAEGWSENTQTVNVAGVTATNVVWVSPAPEHQDVYGSAGIKATAQAEGTLTFMCATVPTEPLNVNVVIG